MTTKTTNELRELAAEADRYMETHKDEHKAACEKLIPIYRDRLNDPDRDLVSKRQDATILERLEKSLARYDANHHLLLVS